MATRPDNAEAVGIAVFAKAPRPGDAKSRLIPALGAAGAARLQRRLTLNVLRLAARFNRRDLTLWCAPDAGQRFFRALHTRHGIATRAQAEGDLGRRMAQAFVAHDGPLLLIGTDCPALRLEHLTTAAHLLHSDNDAVFIPAEDGGYVLVGLRRPQERLFEEIDWGSAEVMAQTRARLAESALRWAEPFVLWDVDLPEDLPRLAALDGLGKEKDEK